VTRQPVPAAVSERLAADLASARAATRAGNEHAAWSLLEEAHVLSQPWAWPHFQVHAAMLALGWRTRDRREVTGQLLRIVVPATQPMPVPDDLRTLLETGDG
jgi:hypothetical protein